MGALVGHEFEIQLRADFLENREVSTWMGTGGGIGAMSGENSDRNANMARRGGHWRERDLQRALGVAKRARLSRYKVEISPDGTITIVVGFGEGRGKSARR